MKHKNFILITLITLLPLSIARANHQASIEDAWIADAPPIAKIRAAYLKLYNGGKHNIEIKSFSSPDFKKIELHKTILADGMVRMEEIKRLIVKPGETIEFKPGGYHLMLFNPKRKLQKNDQIKMLLILDDNKTTSFTAIVRNRGDDMRSRKHQHKCGAGKCGGG